MGPGRVVLASAALFGLYLLLAGGVGGTELLAGAGSVGLVSILIVLLHRNERRRLRVRPPMRLPWRVTIALFADTVRVGRSLLAAILRRPATDAGACVPVPFVPGMDDPDDAGRRGLVTLAASLAPNGFVLAVPPGRPVLLVHRLVPAPVPSDRVWPV